MKKKLVLIIAVIIFALVFFVFKPKSICESTFTVRDSESGQCKIYIGCSLPTGVTEDSSCKEKLKQQIDEENSVDISNCKYLGETPQMIGPGIINSSSCCEGLKPLYSTNSFSSSCVNLFEANGGGGNPSVCLACGNEVCDPNYESRCNCPADCK